MHRKEMDVFDLLNEKHLFSRSLIQQEWNKQSNIQLSITEWYILHLLYNKTYSVIELSKKAEITRQAAHKAVNKLEGFGLISSSFLKNNKRTKVVSLTEQGNTCYSQHKALRNDLENKVIKKIGQEHFNLLKGILATDWTIDSK